MPTTAVLVIDMQNGFLHPEGSLARAGMGLPDAEPAVRATRALLASARASGLPVLYTRQVVSEGAPEMSPRWRAAAAPALAVEPRMLSHGSWDAEIIDRLAPKTGEVVVDKNRYDAFLYTDLEDILRGLGTERLVVAGVLTNVCVESTVRSALERRFNVAVAADATAAYDGFLAPSLAAMTALYGTVAPWSELVPATR
ncbi:cysteine hydrolase family protein [Amycolatopsis pithecellobii]|uniref:Isochorismatase family protein n=1 Tax=Amycolatopsis pithecellobii TaxID=664692 RepID=A0A6N7Z8C3_9PSEU|nr:isochorismatase family cysteine hydrolase [Amycolatopsis pithecellobii]MTD57874.1 isochorismatase family protein [Amycolatopsis pithecellobii]